MKIKGNNVYRVPSIVLYMASHEDSMVLTIIYIKRTQEEK